MSAHPGTRSLTAEDARLCLVEGLRGLVPIHLMVVRRLTPAQRLTYPPPGWRGILGQLDAIQWKPRDWRATVRGFNVVSAGLAVAACNPGGVTAFSGELHWCKDDHPGCPLPPRPEPVDVGPWWAPLEELAALEGWPPLADDWADEDEPEPAARGVDDVYLPGDGPC